MPRRLDVDGHTVSVWVPVREEFVGWNGVEKQTPEQTYRVAEHIKAAIFRHLAHEFSGKWEGITVTRKANFVCDSCGAPWTEKSEHYNGGCCDADVEDHEQDLRDNGPLGVGA